MTLDRIICLPYSMGLDTNYAPDEIQRIKIDAPIVDTQEVPTLSISKGSGQFECFG
jgi:hypothetical protein